MKQWRVSHLVDGRWQKDAICTGPDDLAQYLTRLSYDPKLGVIRVDECDSDGEILQ